MSGKGWARFALMFGAVWSVAGNVASTTLTDSTVSLWLRVPMAVVWPVALFIGIEVLVRVAWRAGWLDRLGRLVLWLPVGTVAAVVSYRHLHHLMVTAGEDGFSALIGPAGIDGLMIGGTVALLAIRAHENEHRAPAPAPSMDPAPVAPDPAPAAPELGLELGDWASVFESTDAPTSPAPVSPAPAMPARRRASTDDISAAVVVWLHGDTLEHAASEYGVGVSTMRRYERAWRMLQDSPLADLADVDIDCVLLRIKPEIVEIIRRHVIEQRQGHDRGHAG